MNKCFLTFDIEEWFQVENMKSAIRFDEWDEKPSSVFQNTKIILNILSQFNVQATFFILGWIAEKHQEVVKAIDEAGHEIGCHGYGHELVFKLNETELREDIHKSKTILENLLGKHVNGYRSPSFSMHPKLFQILKDEKLSYDSSFNPFSLNSRYGKMDQEMKKIADGCYQIENGLFELPISSVKIHNFNFPIGGGGYFRIFPFWFLKNLIRKRLKQEGAYSFYLHPWEFEPEQPRINEIPLSYRFRQYYGLKNTRGKLIRFIKFLQNNKCQFYSMNDFVRIIKPKII